MKQDIPMRSIAILVAFALTLASVGCITPPLPTEVSISARLLPRAAILSRYGKKAGENPFIEPSGIFMGQREEFAVVELGISLPAKSTLSIAAQLDGSEGPGAELKLREDFHLYWSTYEDIEGGYLRSSKIDSACPISAQFDSSAGTRTYYLVFVGKNPIPRPAEISVQVVIKGQPMKAFTIPLTNPVPEKGPIK